MSVNGKILDAMARAKFTELENDLAALRAKHTAVLKAKDEADRQITSYQAVILRMHDQLDERDQTIARLEAQLPL